MLTRFQADPRWVWLGWLQRSSGSIFLGTGRGAASQLTSRTQYVYEADSAAFSADTAAPPSILCDSNTDQKANQNATNYRR